MHASQVSICLGISLPKDLTHCTGFCDSSRCLTPGSRELEEPCQSDRACASDLFCANRNNLPDDGICADDTYTPKPYFSMCNQDRECESGHCGSLNSPLYGFIAGGHCSYPIATGFQCAIDSDCASGDCALSQTYSDFTTCQAALAAPSQRARAKRRLSLMGHRERFACPMGFRTCSLGAGYECIDTTSSLEHCGGCSNAEDPAQRGFDCSELSGLGTSSVACVDSQCVASESFATFLDSPRTLADTAGATSS